MDNLRIQFVTPCIGLMAFEILRASLWNDKKIKVEISALDPTLPCDGILISNKVKFDFDQFKHADKIFFCNADEPLSVANDQIKFGLETSNAWMICNAFVTDDHPLVEKVIGRSNDLMITRQFWTNSLFPLWHDNQKNQSIAKSRNFWAINGENRSWRHHVFTSLRSVIPDLDFHSVISQVIHETNDSWWESEQDLYFRYNVNETYPITRNHSTTYYDNSIKIAITAPTIGLPQECLIPLGYSIMPQYWQSKCVIFPESGWQNGELNVTEKIAKCFFARCLPFPIGGSKINQLYKQLGFWTAWNLLPNEMQIYDDELDHFKRHNLTVMAIKYLYDHPDLLDSDQAKFMISENYVNFLTDKSDLLAVNQLRNIFSI